jgi:hypothetical protein
MANVTYETVNVREAICPCCNRRQHCYVSQNDGEVRIQPHFIGRSSTKCTGAHELACQVQSTRMTLVRKVS